MMNNKNERMGKGVIFERIRRITGYLTGSLETWNNAKKAEERDRVKHGISENTSSICVKHGISENKTESDKD